jgi:hypothetical protein
MSSRSLVGSFILLLSLLLLRRIRAETEVYLAPRLKWKRIFFLQFQLIASASSSKCASIFFFEDDGVGCVYSFVTSAIPVAKNPIWKEMAADTS